MKKNLTEIAFIPDRSGSMAGLEGDTIDGFNAMIARQKGEFGEAICQVRSCAAPLQADGKARIDKDFKTRGKK